MYALSIVPKHWFPHQTPLTLGACVLPAPALGSPGAAVPPHAQAPQHPAHPAPPCSTLFVANLGQFVSEHELKEIFSRYDILILSI